MIKVNGEEVEFKKFPNGETYFTHQDEEWGGMNLIEYKYTGDASLIELLFLKKFIDQTYSQDQNYLRITYMPYSRLDRTEGNNIPFTLKYVTEYINWLNFEHVSVIEPHSDVTTALFNRCGANFVNYNLIKNVFQEIEFDESKDVLFFPDAGASKRYKKMKYPFLTGHKDRDFLTGGIKSLEVVGKIPKEGFRVVIVDDLSSRGGTFMHSAKKLKELGAGDIYLVVAHCEDTIFKGDIFKTNYIKKVFTTDSLLTEHEHWHGKQLIDLDKLQVYQLEEVLS